MWNLPQNLSINIRGNVQWTLQIQSLAVCMCVCVCVCGGGGGGVGGGVFGLLIRSEENTSYNDWNI